MLVLLAIAVFSLEALAQDEIDARTASASAQTAQIPGVNHIIWIWFENRENTAITAATAPNFTSFAAANVNMTNFYGVTHPSQPNYLDAFSGSNQGVLDDAHYTIPANVDNLPKQLAAAGKSWRSYEQNFPGNCSDADSANGGIDGPGVAGQYVRKHNPAISFESVRLDAAQCANIQPLANFDPLVNFAFVVPNMINDMHDGTTAQGDTFLQNFLPLVTASPDFAHTLLIVSFDEGSTNTNGGGHIYTAIKAPWLAARTVTTTYNHFSMLRTIEAIYGLPFLGAAATATTMTEILPPPRGSFDFDGDGKTDLSIFRPAAGEWWWSKSSTGGNGAVQFGQSTDKLAPVDFTGDGKTDVAFWRPSTGFWFVLRSDDFSFYSFPFGATGDLPAPADYDGDGKADAAVFRPSTSTWFISKSSGGTQITAFGAAGDQPDNADFDGDGKSDIAIFRPNGANGAEWWIQRSSNGTVFALQFGTSTDKTVAADYTGDGKADIAFFRPSNANWFVLRSEDLSFFAFPFGSVGDIPAPGDYDGDGKTDAAVFRPSNSTWFAQRSTAGTLIQQFGTAGDIPLPNTFVR